MSEPHQPRLFISYSRVDRHTTEQLVKHLRRSFDNVWFDESLHGGQVWWDEILSQIAGCDIFLYLLSRDSVESEYCRAELEEAKRLRKQILPVLIRARTTIPEDLQHIQFVDLSRGFTPESVNDLQGALIRIERRISRTPITPLSGEAPPIPDVTDDHPTPAPIPVQRPEDGRRLPFTIGLVGGLLVIAAIAALLFSRGGFVGQSTATPTIVVGAQSTVTSTLTVAATNPPTSTRAPAPTSLPTNTLTSTATLTRTQNVEPVIAVTTTPTPRSGCSTYTVRAGDTLFSIAEKLGVSVAALVRANALTEQEESRLQVDQILIIPSDGCEVATENPKVRGSGGGKIVFRSNRDGNYEIYAMDADGKNQQNLSNNPADDFSPASSPNGKRIVFRSYRDGNYEIYAMDADGKNQQNLSNNPASDADPAWSPDGKRIAFATNRDGNYEIYAMDADGRNQQNLSNNPADDSDPAWSPDGKRIVFSSVRDDSFEIYAMDADGKNQQNLSNNSSSDGDPAWSPDGKLIAFTSFRLGNANIVVMNPDGKNPRHLTSNRAGDSNPAWSPDGKRIVFGSDRDGNTEIYIMDTDGQNQVNLSNHSAEDEDPAWSP